MIRVEITPGSITVTQDDYVVFESLTELSPTYTRSVIIDIDQVVDLLQQITGDEVILTEAIHEQ